MNHRTCVLTLAVLLAAATAVADVVSMPQESVPGRIIDTLVGAVSPADMAAKCREMDVALRGCGRSDDTVVEMLREVSREEDALRIGRHAGTWCTYASCGALPGTAAGTALGFAIDPPNFDVERDAAWSCGSVVLGAVVGCAAGSLIGIAIGRSQRVALIARHRHRVNNLVRRANRAVATPP